MTDSTNDEDGFELVMPFVVAKSNGGPYEDHDFAAGFQLGEISGALRTRSLQQATYTIFSDSKTQVDLICMNHGYTCLVMDGKNDEWITVIVTRIERDNESR